jgi:hypothetical protein
MKIVVTDRNIIYRDGVHAGCIYWEDKAWTAFVHTGNIEETFRAKDFNVAVRLVMNFFEKVEETA